MSQCDFPPKLTTHWCSPCDVVARAQRTISTSLLCEPWPGDRRGEAYFHLKNVSSLPLAAWLADWLTGLQSSSPAAPVRGDWGVVSGHSVLSGVLWPLMVSGARQTLDWPAAALLLLPARPAASCLPPPSASTKGTQLAALALTEGPRHQGAPVSSHVRGGKYKLWTRLPCGKNFPLQPWLNPANI